MSTLQLTCEIGVHTRGYDILFTDETWAELKRQMPARMGHRRWNAIGVEGHVRWTRTQFTGSTPTAANAGSRGLRGMVRMHVTDAPIVRCSNLERPIRIDSSSRFTVLMPPYHEWPWIQDSPTIMTPLDRRRRLVDELNARVQSAIKHGVELPSNIPQWVSRMLTGPEWVRVHRNEEIV